MSRAIVTVGVSSTRVFGPYHERSQRTLEKFSCADEILRWSNDWPSGGASHAEINYGFKVRAMEVAKARGFSSILWLDVSCYAVAPLEPLWQEIEHEGHFLAGQPSLDPSTGFVSPDHQGPFDNLGEWSSDLTLETFKLTRDAAFRVPLLCGCCVGLSLKSARSSLFLQQLVGFAVPEHFNGTHKSGILGTCGGTASRPVSTDPRCKGHRSDEVYMALLARELKMSSHAEFFGGGIPNDKPSIVLRSGYDIPGAYKP